MKRILLVDDEPQITSFIQRGLAYKGFQVMVVACGEAALDLIRDCPPDLVVLDMMLPDVDGCEVCRRVRAAGDRNLPVLMLTARDSLNDKVNGLDSGADDYITKPFAFEELLARIRAGLRRVENLARQNQKIEAGELVIDPVSRQVWRSGALLELTTREYNLLELMVQHAGQVLTKEMIFERVWGYDNEAELEVIKVYINYLRTKLNAGNRADLIHTVRGIGYVLKP